MYWKLDSGIFGGMSFVITIETMFTHGLKFSIMHDRKRQTVLNLICFIASLAAVVRFPLNATEQSVWASNILNIIMFFCVQLGLGILNHNTL
jgi:hypothetical protein